jgi:hypothetical protein
MWMGRYYCAEDSAFEGKQVQGIHGIQVCESTVSCKKMCQEQQIKEGDSRSIQALKCDGGALFEQPTKTDQSCIRRYRGMVLHDQFRPNFAPRRT